MMARKERQSNIELLRIIAMMLIVIHHFIVHGVFANTDTFGGVIGTVKVPFKDVTSNIIGQMIAGGGKIGVDLFIIITGYFMCKSLVTPKKQFKKLNSLHNQVWFYTLGILAITIIFHLMKISGGIFIRSILPISFSAYWFITDYFVLYLVSPFINRMLAQFDQKTYRWFLIIMGAFAIIFPTFLRGSFVDTANNLVLFIFCYVFGAYIRNFEISYKMSEKSFGKVLLFSSLSILWALLLILNLLAVHFHSRFIYMRSFIFDGQQSVFVFGAALGLFLWGKNWNLGVNKVINMIAATTLGIYLIHDNPIVEQVLWIKWLHLPDLISAPMHILLAAVIVCPLVFIVCSLIEYLRQLFVSKIIHKA